MSSRRRYRHARFLKAAAVLAAAALIAGGFVAFVLAQTGDSSAATPLTTSAAYEPPFVPTFQAIGDSFTGGSDEGGGDGKGWPYLVMADYYAKTGGKVYLHKTARGGSGYVQLGPSKQTFGQAVGADDLIDLDVVVVFGSINDQKQAPAAVEAAATKLYADLKRRSPKATIIVVGPSWVNDEPVPEIYGVRDAVQSAAAAAGLRFIDPLADGWFTGESAKLIGSDKTHPTDAGHKYMADKLKKPILAALASAVATHKQAATATPSS